MKHVQLLYTYSLNLVEGFVLGAHENQSFGSLRRMLPVTASRGGLSVCGATPRNTVRGENESRYLEARRGNQANRFFYPGIVGLVMEKLRRKIDSDRKAACTFLVLTAAGAGTSGAVLGIVGSASCYCFRNLKHETH